MKVITLKQPWASLVAEGIKIWEFRSWKYNYRGEILIGLHNFGVKAKKIFDGDRVAQAEIIKVWRVHNTEVKELSSTERGTGGFGSSGSK